jgi:hypothetical protein
MIFSENRSPFSGSCAEAQASALNLKFATLLDRDPSELQIQKAH